MIRKTWPSNLKLLGVVKLIKEGRVHNIITMCGAGISTAAGIPDFRSPGSGLYDNLAEYNLTSPMDVFTISFFDRDPRPFFEVARKLYKPDVKNVDGLEAMTGLDKSKIIEAHGTFSTGHCRRCRKKFDFDYMKEKIMNKEIPKCNASACDGVVKPDLVFFGENLPRRFYNSINSDFRACDLLLIAGTSLTVKPFCNLIHNVSNHVPRVYVNRTYEDGYSGWGIMPFILHYMVSGLKRPRYLRFNQPDNKRDVFLKGSSDDVLLELAVKLGWKEELEQLKASADAKQDSAPLKG